MDNVYFSRIDTDEDEEIIYQAYWFEDGDTVMFRKYAKGRWKNKEGETCSFTVKQELDAKLKDWKLWNTK